MAPLNSGTQVILEKVYILLEKAGVKEVTAAEKVLIALVIKANLKYQY